MGLETATLKPCAANSHGQTALPQRVSGFQREAVASGLGERWFRLRFRVGHRAREVFLAGGTSVRDVFRPPRLPGLRLADHASFHHRTVHVEQKANRAFIRLPVLNADLPLVYSRSPCATAAMPVGAACRSPDCSRSGHLHGPPFGFAAPPCASAGS